MPVAKSVTPLLKDVHANAVRTALVVWSGRLGGSETFTVELAGALRREGVDARLVFVGSSDRLRHRVEELGVPAVEVGLPRGRHVLLHPRRLAQRVFDAGPDCALLPSSGYLAASLRAGGYARPLAAVEHGGVLQLPQLPSAHRWLRRLDRASGVWTCSVEIAVSDFVLQELKTRRHARRLVRIRNGIDLTRFSPSRNVAPDRPFTVGYAGRLIPSKGVADLIRAFASADLPANARLLIAGDGDQRPALQTLAQGAKVGARTQFLGRVDDMPGFWRRCDVGAVPSSQWIESFCLAGVEAMACGLPVVATRIGALPEIVKHGQTGLLVEAGDVDEFAHSLAAYARESDVRAQHGLEARALCEREYDLAVAARSYAQLIHSLSGR
jgi:glycosyltransferase involved in cell wall biosynthesis